MYVYVQTDDSHNVRWGSKIIIVCAPPTSTSENCIYVYNYILRTPAFFLNSNFTKRIISYSTVNSVICLDVQPTVFESPDVYVLRVLMSRLLSPRFWMSRLQAHVQTSKSQFLNVHKSKSSCLNVQTSN